MVITIPELVMTVAAAMMAAASVIVMMRLVLVLLQIYDSLKQERHIRRVILTQVIMCEVGGIIEVAGMGGLITLITGVMVVLHVLVVVLLSRCRPLKLQVLIVVDGQGRGTRSRPPGHNRGQPKGTAFP